jgi:hypothetical protein
VVVALRVVRDGNETVQGINEGKIEGTENWVLSKLCEKLQSVPHTEHNATL